MCIDIIVLYSERIELEVIRFSELMKAQINCEEQIWL